MAHASLPVNLVESGIQHDGGLVSAAASGQHSSIIHEESGLQQRLEKFVTSFTSEIEKKIKGYQAILEQTIEAVNISSSVSESLGKGIGSGVGSGIGNFVGMPGAGGSIGRKVGGVVGERLGGIWHRKKIQALSPLVYHYLANMEAQKIVLVTAGVQIFGSFEMQIMGLKGKTAWQTYVHRLGEDAAHRVINFCAEKTLKIFTIDQVIKGVLQGISKLLNPWLPFMRGLTVKYQEMKVTTEDIFTKVGLVNIENNLYYTRKGNACNCGYRILFSWECDSSGDINLEFSEFYEKCERPKTYDYSFDVKNCREKLKELEIKICKKNMNVTGTLVRQIVQEEKDEIFEEIKKVKQEGHASIDGEEVKHLREQLVQLNMQLKVINKKYKDMRHDIGNTSSLTNEHVSQQQEVMTRNTDIATSNMFDFCEPVKTFIGREEPLKNLNTILHDGTRCVVVSGLGGVGKSELVRMYALQHREEYDKIVWLNAESYDHLKSSFFRLSTKVEVETEEVVIGVRIDRRIVDVVNDIYDALRDKKCLLIFDGALCTADSLNSFLPHNTLNNFHVIITTCNVACDSRISNINLSIFRKSESLELLKVLLGIKYEEWQALQMSKLLNHLPLALQIGAAYIKNQAITISTFIEEYEQKKIDFLLLASPDSSMDNNARSIFTTFQAMLDEVLDKCGEVAIIILNFLAYLSPDNIPLELFSGLGNEIEITTAIQTLEKYFLIRQKPNESVEIPKLVQEVIQKKLVNNEQLALEKVLHVLESKVQENPKPDMVEQAEYMWNYANSYPDLLIKYYKISQYPLHQAVRVGNVKIVEHLLNEKDMYVYERDRCGMTPLYRAITQGSNVDIIKYLIGACIKDGRTLNQDDWKIVEKAAKENNQAILKFLIEESNADMSLDKNILLHLAAQKGRLDVAKYLVDNGADILFSRNKVTIVHEAAYSNNSSMIEYILQAIETKCKNMPKGCTAKDIINGRDNAGDTALMWAAKALKQDAVKALLNNKNVDPKLKNNDGKTAKDLSQQTLDEML